MLYLDLIIGVSENIADWYSKEYRINRPLVIKTACYLYKINNNK